MNEIFKLDLCKVADLIKKREVSALKLLRSDKTSRELATVIERFHSIRCC